MFVLAWTSGHTPPRTMYFMEIGKHWNATEKISEAKRFKSASDAIQTWRTRCTAWPDEPIYKRAVATGAVRAERVDQGGLLL